MVTGLRFDHECFHCKECCFRNLSSHFLVTNLRHCKMEAANTLTNVCLAPEKVHIAFEWRCNQAWHRILLYRWTLRNQSVCQSRHSDLCNIGFQLACNLACHGPACVQTQCHFTIAPGIFDTAFTSIVEVGPIFGPTLGNLRSCILDLARSAAAITHLCDLSRNGNTRIATSPLAYARRVSSRHYHHPVFRSC